MYTLKLERVLLIVLLKNVLLTAGQQTGNPEKPTHGLCEPITIPICQGIGYNQTIMPNILGHETQTDAGFEVTVYHPLVSIKCSPHLRLFLCALYLPVCTILTEPVPPCRSVCIAARDGCSGTMNRFGHDWPEHMACEKFPELPELCVGPNETTTNNQPTNSYPSHGQPNGGQPNGGQSTNHQSFNGEGVAPNTPNYNKNNFWNPLQPQQTLPTLHNPQIVAGDETRNTLLPPQKSVISGVCPLTWRTEPKLKYKLQLTQLKGYEMEDCGLPCKGVLFDENNETLARYWIGVWAILCFVSTLFTVLTFLIDMDRFSYPERPIIFISGCYLIVSICYIVGFILEDKASCITASGGELVVTQGTKNEGCTILFMLTYFFTMASSIWWVILTLTWVLAAGLKWGHEAIESNSQYFHLAAWAVPAIKTITIIALRSIDGDVLSGM
ncbi:FZD7 [Bugula neritina]|uniref:FZD7 n=1 Tax=Bugula neritina TaxID=10212 RepID=A0A7J7K2B7_BUGNE|nr:FZD7 [Bugula neritina]